MARLHFVCTFALVCALAGHAFAQSGGDNATLAQQRYRQGLALYEAHNYEGALSEFRAAQSIYASPNSRLMIARCLRGMQHYDDAVLEYELTAREATDRAATDVRYAATREAAENEMRSIFPNVGRLRLNIPNIPNWAWIRVNDRDVPIEALGLAIPVNPGAVTVRIEAFGYRPTEQSFSIAAGESRDVNLQLDREPNWNGAAPTSAQLSAWHSEGGVSSPPPSSAPPPSPSTPLASPGTPTVIAAGVGVVGLLVGVVFGALTATQYNSVSAQCNNMPCPANLQGAVDEGRAFQTIADTGFVIGGLGIATAAVLYFAVDRPNAQHRHEVHVGIQGTMLMVTGTF